MKDERVKILSTIVENVKLIGAEDLPPKKAKRNNFLKRIAVWLITILFSLLPLFLKLFFPYVLGQVDFFYFTDIFKDVSIVYTGATALVTAFIGMIGNGSAKGKTFLISSNLLLLLLGTATYGMFNAAITLDAIPSGKDMIFNFNITYLIITMIIGIIDIYYNIDT